MPRTFMNTPGDEVTVTVSGPTGVGKTQIAGIIANFLRDAGLSVTEEDREKSTSSVVKATYQTGAAYLESLGVNERETLRRHLDALGYEL